MSLSPLGRRRAILDALHDQGGVEVNDLAHHLGVTAETVRRDLGTLDREGLLCRTHGGARVPSQRQRTTPEPAVGPDAAGAGTSPRLEAMAHACLQLLEPWESVYLDAGPPTLAVAEALLETDRPLTVVTPSVAVASTLSARPRTELYLVGGQLHAETQAAHGRAAAAMLSDLLPGVVVMTASGVSPRDGAAASHPDLARLKQVAMASCRHSVLVGEHPTFETPGASRFAAVEDFDEIVTDRGLGFRTVERYAAHNVRVVLA